MNRRELFGLFAAAPLAASLPIRRMIETASGTVYHLQDFSALLEKGLTRVFDDDLHHWHPECYEDWLSGKPVVMEEA